MRVKGRLIRRSEPQHTLVELHYYHHNLIQFDLCFIWRWRVKHTFRSNLIIDDHRILDNPPVQASCSCEGRSRCPWTTHPLLHPSPSPSLLDLFKHIPSIAQPTSASSCTLCRKSYAAINNQRATQRDRSYQAVANCQSGRREDELIWTPLFLLQPQTETLPFEDDFTEETLLSRELWSVNSFCVCLFMPLLCTWISVPFSCKAELVAPLYSLPGRRHAALVVWRADWQDCLPLKLCYRVTAACRPPYSSEGAIHLRYARRRRDVLVQLSTPLDLLCLSDEHHSRAGGDNSPQLPFINQLFMSL